MRKQITRFLIIFLLANSSASFAMRLTQCYERNALPAIMAKKATDYVQEAQHLLQVKRALETYQGGAKLTNLPEDVIFYVILEYFDDPETVKNVHLVSRYFRDEIDRKFEVIDENDYFHSPSLSRFLLGKSRIIKNREQLEGLAKKLSSCQNKIFIYKSPGQSFLIDKNRQNLFSFLLNKSIREKYLYNNYAIIWTIAELNKLHQISEKPADIIAYLAIAKTMLFITTKYLINKNSFFGTLLEKISSTVGIVVKPGKYLAYLHCALKIFRYLVRKKLAREATLEQREEELDIIEAIAEEYFTRGEAPLRQITSEQGYMDLLTTHLRNSL